MGNKKIPKSKIEDFFKAQLKHHKELAKLSFEKKIEILFQLQEMAKSIRKIGALTKTGT